jgi:putative transposase
VEPNLAPELKEELLGRWEPVYRSQLHYLVTWGSRGRRSILKYRHVRFLESLLERVCAERGITLVEKAIGSDHVHVLIGLPPSQSVSSAVRELKSRTGMTLLSEFPELRVWLRGNITWDERYAVETVSAGRVDRVRGRLRDLHAPPEELAEAS